MIVITTANGDRFINEAEVKSVSHNKEYAAVLITFKDGTTQGVYQVEGMLYTNKSDKEIHDIGLMLGGARQDAEYYHQLNESAENFVEELQRWRNELENFILGYLGQPDEPYAVRFVKELEEKREERPDYQRDELERYRDRPWFNKLRADCKQKGDEAEKEFARLTAKIQQLEDMNRRYREADERIMKRNLWERIINKKTYL